MKLYVSPFAPNPMRVEILALEKGIVLEKVDTSSIGRDAYAAINPLGQVPALVLDDGSVLTESLVICRYLDETSGAPSLFGTTPIERAWIGMWDRRAETLLFNAAVDYGHHIHPMFAQWQTQYPEWARTLLPRAEQMVELIARQLQQHEFIAGHDISVADFTAALGYFAFVAWGGLTKSNDSAVADWAGRMFDRPSMAPWRTVDAAFQSAANISAEA